VHEYLPFPVKERLKLNEFGHVTEAGARTEIFVTIGSGGRTCTETTSVNDVAWVVELDAIEKTTLVSTLIVFIVTLPTPPLTFID
jgi:hypothetical protein